MALANIYTRGAVPHVSTQSMSKMLNNCDHYNMTESKFIKEVNNVKIKLSPQNSNVTNSDITKYGTTECASILKNNTKPNLCGNLDNFIEDIDEFVNLLNKEKCKKKTQIESKSNQHKNEHISKDVKHNKKSSLTNNFHAESKVHSLSMFNAI